MIRFLLLVGMLCVLFLTACDRCGRGLQIEREYRSAKESDGKGEELLNRERLESELVRSTFLLPPTVFIEYPRGVAADPFAKPAKSPKLVKRNARESLENAGVSFEGEANATYDPTTQILTVDQTEEQMDLVEAFIGSFLIDLEKQIFIQAEVYELPAQLGLEAIDSASSEGEHSPERNAVAKAIKEGRGDLVAASALICRSGQRAKVAQLQRDIVASAKREASEEKGKGKETDKPNEWEIPLMELEVDPVLGADGHTIDLNFSLELSTRETASPRRDLAEGMFRDEEHSLMTQVTVKDGRWQLAGNWAVDEGEKIRLVFLRASIQVSGGYSQLTPVVSP